MSQPTKSKGVKDIYDRFYTPTQCVKQCLSLLNFADYDCIIEPSAGSGRFKDEFPDTTPIFTFDIAPARSDITQADWLAIDKTTFNNYHHILICGNPPYGQQNSLAIKFFNESAKIADTIAFILPPSFKKASVINRLNQNFILSQELALPDISFDLYNHSKIIVPCIFQIWRRATVKRPILTEPRLSCYFDFVVPEKADIRVARVGGRAGKASLDLGKSVSSNYFITNNTDLSNNELVNFINQLDFPSINFTVGPKSLSKSEFIQVFEKEMKNLKNK